MNIYAISDLHLSTVVNKPMDVFGRNWDNYMDTLTADWLARVTPDDVVLLPGDFSWAMRIEEVIPDFDRIKSLPGKKVILRGNHDFWWNTISQVRAILPEGFYAIQNDVVRFGDVLICGTRGWVCPENDKLGEQDRKIYNREVERLKLSLIAMNKERKANDRVVCMMHFPPFNVYREENGFTELFIRNDIKTVVYGHLHGKDSRVDKHIKRFGIDFYLVSTDIIGHKLINLTVDPFQIK